MKFPSAKAQHPSQHFSAGEYLIREIRLGQSALSHFGLMINSSEFGAIENGIRQEMLPIVGAYQGILFNRKHRLSQIP